MQAETGDFDLFRLDYETSLLLFSYDVQTFTQIVTNGSSKPTSHPTGRRSKRSAVPPNIRHPRLRRIGIDLIVGLLLTSLLIGGKYLLEQTRPAGFVEESLYNWLQFKLRPAKQQEDIVVVDIRNLAVENGYYTSRPQLQQLLQTLLRDSDHRPRAIGIDIDFSPKNEGLPLTDRDEEFLNFCLDRRFLVNNRIFVGIDSSLRFGPDAWLISPKYRSLAAYVGRAVPEKKSVTSTNPKVDQWVNVPYMDDKGNEETACILSLGTALAGPPLELKKEIRWAVHRSEDVREEGISYRQFWVDFSPIDYFRAHAVIVSLADGRPTTGSLAQLADKIVLVGRGLGEIEDQGLQATDIFHVPGHAEDYAGVYLHACAIYTLLRPVFHLSGPGRVVMDTVFSLAAFGFIALIRLFYSGHRKEVNIAGLSRLVTWFALAAVFIVGELMLNITRLLWDDYLVVMIALIAHSWVERHEGLAHEATVWLHTRWRGLVLQKPPKPQRRP
jgi:CHASE2 domain-containing sensor protein